MNKNMFRLKNSQGSAKVVVLTFVATLLLIGGGAFGALKYLGKSLPSLMSAPEPSTETHQQPIFVPLDKFVISLTSDSVVYYMMLELTLLTGTEAYKQQIENYLPLIRNNIVTNLSGRDFKSIHLSLKNLGQLQDELLVSLKSGLTEHGIDSSINSVLITKIVIQ